MNRLLQDVKFALRQMRKAPVFTVTAVLTLALGMGAATTIYSVVHDVLLAPLPYPEQDRLVGIAFMFPQEKPNAEESGQSGTFLREHTRSFQSVGVAEDSTYAANLSSAGGQPLPVASVKVSQGYLPTLGISPIIGRSFTTEEDLPGGPKVAMLGYRLWERTFASDAAIVGRIVRINEQPYTVVGVLPESIAGAAESGGVLAGDAGVWLPLQMSSKDPGYEGDNYVMVGRLRAGVTAAQAQAELEGLKTPFYSQFPSVLAWTSRGKLVHEFRIWPLQTVLVSEVRRSLLVLLAAVLAVLLVACLNLAGLMTARVATRRRELALRTSLGATRARLLQLLVSEAVILAVAGAGLGLIFAQVARPALLAASPLTLPLRAVHAIGGRLSVAAFVFVAGILTTLACGLLPAWSVFRQNAQDALRGGHTAGGDAAQVRTGKVLMVAQVSVTMVLLSAATLLFGSFMKLRSVASGVETQRLAVAQVSLKGLPYTTNLHTTQFVEKVLGELAQYPGVERVAAANGFPLDQGLNTGGHPADQPDMKQTVELRAITPGYFRTLGVPLLNGRDMTEDDSAKTQKVVLVNQTAARKWWPGRSPIGERILLGGKDEPQRIVVGVVADTRNHSLSESPRVTIYQPFTQMSDSLTKTVNGWFPTTFAIRLSRDIDLSAAVKSAVSHADPEIPVVRLRTMQEMTDRTVAKPRFFSFLSGGFAGFAVLLMVIGLFGLLSYQVTQRTREIGVRLAVGATRGQILMLILKRGLMLTTIGLAVGVIASLAVPRVVTSLLEDILFTGGAPINSSFGGSTVALTSAALAMMLAATFASYLPARRAASTEPTQALRTE